ncbi:hypothetical protein HPB49_005157 [Dermacentor silvarum]|uniref:Uncharacterized protein n=1 Tax=Dermacentor silvarum TaxID=543639 RepID=A0ACB8CQ04_DERSI|nr:hypothetical protein HPB49_005157 [Dermacentor silvarum]
MALLEQRGYDPTTLSWSSIPANQPEDGPPNISAEQAVIFPVVESRRRRRQNARGAATSNTPLNNSAKGDARAPSTSSKAPQKTSSRVSSWTPKPTVRMTPDDYVIVLKPHYGRPQDNLSTRVHMNAITISPNWEQNIIVCGTQNPEVVQKLLMGFQLNTSKGPLPLHGHLKLTGDVCRGVISVHNVESIHYNAELTPVKDYKKTVPACYRCGTPWHRADNCPNPVNERWVAPHECNPMCIVCEGPHLTGSRECTRKFIRLQQPGPRTSGPPATSRRQPAGKAPITPPKGANLGATRESHATGRQQVNQETPSRGVTSPPDKTAAATPLPGEEEFPALSAPTGGAACNQSKVGNWARVASCPPPHPSSPTSTAEMQELRRELALLRAQNEKLASELNSFRTQFGTRLASSGESRVAALETQVTVVETQLADLPKIIHDTIARQMDSVITQVTQAVTRIIQKWIQDNPRVLKRVGPIRDDNRPSKFNKVIPDESDFSEDSCTSVPATSGLGIPNSKSQARATQPLTLTQWNCAGLKDRKKRANLHLYLETLEFLVTLVALQNPGAGVKLTNYTTLQHNPQTCILVNKQYTAQDATLPTTPPFSYTMVSALPLRWSDPPVHIINIYCPPKFTSFTFSEIFTQAMQVAGRDPLLIVGDFNATSRLWGYSREDTRGRKLAELLSTLGLTLHTDPASPTRVGNSIQRNTWPDLTVTGNIRHADWLNTEDTLSSDHCIINTTIYMRPLKRPLTQARVPD